MAIQLTANAFKAIDGGNFDEKPLVQVVDVRKVNASQERYRAWVADGSDEVKQALLATQLNDLVKRGEIRNGSVVQLLEYMSSNVQTRKLLVILNLQIMITQHPIIGNPKLPLETLPSNQIQNPTSQSNPTPNSNPNPIPKPSIFQPMIQPPYKPAPNFKSHNTIFKNEAPARVIPISVLNPYQGRWAIKARVTAKSEIRRYNNSKGDGKVFSFDLLDSEEGEIRVTCFNNLVDKFYELVENGKVYLVSKGSLKPAQKNFNHLSNEWEILLDNSSTVDLCDDEITEIPSQKFNFKLISSIENEPNNSIIDLVGIVTVVNPSVTILRKNGMETQKRVINLKDNSNKSVELTLWGEFCNREGRDLQLAVDSATFPVVAIKAGKVSDFNGKSVGTIHSTQIFINPDLSETRDLKSWFENQGKNMETVSISKDGNLSSFSRNEVRKTVSQIKDERLGMGEKPDWVTVKGIISFIKTDNFCYTACPLMIGERKCSKKVNKSSDGGKWSCERCEAEFDECDFRYLLQVQVQDHTGITWVTAFQESGEEITGRPAKELYRIRNEEMNENEFGEIIKGCLFEQFLFKLKIKEESYGDEQRVKVTVVKAEKVDPAVESRVLLDLISRISG
ncbi:hypothetical protein LUZ60_000946 [Juncus effusus]|nr:hypothetical protein LUZ60_000946 [Juncus effusus]